MHVMMDDTALSADAPDWFHVPHTTVVNMHQKQVQSLMASYAPVPTHLVPPSLLDGFKLRHPTPAARRPTTSASGGYRGGGRTGLTAAQLGRRISKATLSTYEVGPGRECLPRHSPHFRAVFIELNGIT